ncbi:MAG TPA: hypothetical protein VGK15_04180 [Candidatus Limnocylindria bacterium]|jgi:hypothetical protein
MAARSRHGGGSGESLRNRQTASSLPAWPPARLFVRGERASRIGSALTVDRVQPHDERNVSGRAEQTQRKLAEGHGRTRSDAPEDDRAEAATKTVAPQARTANVIPSRTFMSNCTPIA